MKILIACEESQTVCRAMRERGHEAYSADIQEPSDGHPEWHSANPLYQCGSSRIGCIGCPMQGFKGMKAKFARYPIYRLNYVKAFDRMIEEHKRRYLPTNWETGEEVMRWWVGDDPRQITLEDMQ